MKKLLVLLFLAVFAASSAVVQAQVAGRTVAGGTITALNGSVQLSLEGQKSAGYILTGTWTATVQAQISMDGTNWQGVDSYDFNTEAVALNITANDTYAFSDLRGAQFIRVTATAFTSGTITVTLNANQAEQIQNTKFDGVAGSAVPKHAAYICGTDGTNCQPLVVGTGGAAGIIKIGSAFTPVDGAANTELDIQGPGNNRGVRADTYFYNGATWDLGFHCNKTAKLNALGAATTQIVALSAGTKIRVCSAVLENNSGTATNIKFVEGTGTNCATGQTDLTGLFVLGANTLASDHRVISLGNAGAWITNTAGDALCVTGSAAGSAEITITYEQH